MIVNFKTAKALSISLKRRPLLGRAAVEQLTNYDYPDVRFWQRQCENALEPNVVRTDALSADCATRASCSERILRTQLAKDCTGSRKP
jgi:hypothetical protein